MDDLTRSLENLNSEVISIFHQLDLFQKLNEVIKNNEQLQSMDNTLLLGIRRAFTVDLVISIGRVCDTDRRTTSLVQFLGKLKMHDECLSRQGHLKLYGESRGLIHVGNVTFNNLAGEGVQEYHKENIDRDISRLTEQEPCKKIIGYRHKYIAHSDREREGAFPTYDELFGTFEVIKEILVKYNLLVRAASMVDLTPTMQGNWSEVLTIPWLQEDKNDHEEEGFI